MPIRFACPQCRQRLSVSTRKAGTAADCPRCRRPLTIPQPTDHELAGQTPNGESPLESFLLAQKIGAALDVEQRATVQAERNAAAADVSVVPHAFRGETLQAVSASDSDELQIVVEPPPNQVQSHAPPRSADSLVVPRLAVYFHGGLLAAVACTSLLIGVLMGRTLAPRQSVAMAPRECVVGGQVTFATGSRSRPDRGTVVILLPVLAEAAGERAAVDGLRPSDPPPEADHQGLGTIRQLGGSYTRADANGRFESRLPAPGRYWLLVVSHEKRARAAAETKDIRTLSRYLQNTAELLEDRAYQLTQETIRGDRQIPVAFD